MSPTTRAQQYTTVHARRLRAIAYRMLGSMADAEDIVQEAWLRWAEVDEVEVHNTEAYLTRLVSNLCLDRLGSAAARREQYVGVWLPEPLLDDEGQFGSVPGPEQQAEWAEDVSVAFLLALERLGPLERAAFLLKDVFDMDFDEVAGHLGRSEAACRQLVSRARKHVRAQQPRQAVEQAERERLAEAFVRALATQDVNALASVLAADVLLLSDGGGKVSAVPRALHGAEQVAKVLAAFNGLPAARQWVHHPARINGWPGFVVIDPAASGQVVQTIAFELAAGGGHIAAIYVQRNPDKLAGARAWLAARQARVDGHADVTNRAAVSSGG